MHQGRHRMTEDFNPSAAPGLDPPRAGPSYRRSLIISWLLIVAAVSYVAIGVNVLPSLRKPPVTTTSTTAPADKAVDTADDTRELQLRIAARLAVGSKQMRA